MPFKYHNFIGTVSHEFGLHPNEEHGWETEALEWFTFEEVQEMMRTDPGSFHPGLIKLFKQSGKLIQQICGRAGRGKGKGNGKQDSGNADASTTGNAA